MPVVQVYMRQGRTEEQKRKLMHMITNAMVEAVGADISRVNVIIHEVETDNWAVGGQTLSDQAHNKPHVS